MQRFDALGNVVLDYAGRCFEPSNALSCLVMGS
jgi:hypothetical protein